MRFKFGLWLMRLGGRIAGVRYVDIQYNFQNGEGFSQVLSKYRYTAHASTGFYI